MAKANLPSRKLVCLCFLSSCLCSGELLRAQEISISGTVINDVGRPLSGVEVNLQTPGESIKTDSSGRFVFHLPGSGAYTISAFEEGYFLFQRKYSINNRSKPIRIVLHPFSNDLSEVVVTDRREEDRRRSESLNIGVVNRNFIRRHLGGSLMQTLERLPGVKAIGIGSGQSKPLIRGLGFNRIVVIDKGVKHEGQQWGADHGLEIDQFAAHEIELIKGSASFIYGSDAIGGAINIKPPPIPPLHVLRGAVDIVGKSNNNLIGTSANITGRTQKLFFDARLTYQNYGDYRVPTDKVYVYDYEVGLNKNFLRNTAGREAAFHINTGYILENFRSVFFLSNTYTESGFFANAHGLEPRRVDAVLHDASSRDLLLPRQKVNHFKIINRTGFKYGIHNVETELGYQRNVREEYSQYVNHGYMPPVYPDSLNGIKNMERSFDKFVYSVNLRDEINLGKHSLKLGLNGEYQNNDINGWTFLVPAFRQETFGGFIFDKYTLSERLLFHGAIRYDHGKIRMFEYRDWFPSGDAMWGDTDTSYLVRANNLSRVFRSLVWSAGLNFNLDHFELKINIGKSFRMPIAKELGANGINYHYFSYERGDTSLSAEKSYQADLSLLWQKQKWSVTISPFYNYFPNYIYLNPTARHDYFYGAGNQIFEYAQSRVMRYGGELEMKYMVLPSLSVGFMGEYLYAEQLSGAKKGYTLPFSPPPSGIFNVTWSPLLKCDKIYSSYLSVDFRFAGAQNNIVPPEKKTPGNNSVNVQAGSGLTIGNQKFNIGLQVQNLFNARYLNHTSFYRLIELPEAGRNVIVSLKVPFGIHSAGKQ